MTYKKITGLILKTAPLFDSDKRIEIFTPDHGKLSLLAKHALKIRSKIGSKLDVTHVVRLVTYQSRSFHFISQCDLIDAFPNIRNSYNRLATSFYIIDIIKKTTLFEQNNSKLFDLTLEMLDKLNKNTAIDSVLNDFHMMFLYVEGLLPQKTHITKESFKKIFESYSGKWLCFPSFI